MTEVSTNKGPSQEIDTKAPYPTWTVVKTEALTAEIEVLTTGTEANKATETGVNLEITRIIDQGPEEEIRHQAHHQDCAIIVSHQIT